MVPEIQPPREFTEGIIKAIKDVRISYSDPQGIIELREELCRDLEANFGLKYTANTVTFHAGPKDALFKLCLALLHAKSKRNKTITFAPVFEAFTNVPELITGEPAIILPTDDKFYPRFDVLEKTLEEKHEEIAIIIVCSPNNPSGAVYPDHVMRRLADIIGKYPEIAVISDEVYRIANFTGKKHLSLAQPEYLPRQTFVCGGASKEVAGTGLRLGFCVGNSPNVTKAVVNIQGNASSSVDLPTQVGFQEFLKADRDMHLRNEILQKLRQRRDVVVSQFEKLDGLKSLKIHAECDGAFYYFPDITSCIGKKTPSGTIINDDVDFCMYVLQEGKVALIPGSKFFRAGHFRLAFACSSPERIAEGCQRISDALLRLQ
eukprot:TRINITY_DN3661_c0_g1_i1.p1 TRINITY_DN3661_c0_g1~~TRINITY_DN3661_c0_g1_i1.p1  ORF type:complete len:418 (-),score=106.43 TRINITY_DN3661_c0_g1_i1:50-1174(-)